MMINIFNEKEQFWIKNEINLFNNLKEIKQNILKLKEIKVLNKIKELNFNIRGEYNKIKNETEKFNKLEYKIKNKSNKIHKIIIYKIYFISLYISYIYYK